MKATVTIDNVRRGKKSDIVLSLSCYDKRHVRKYMRLFRDTNVVNLTESKQSLMQLFKTPYINNETRRFINRYFDNINDLKIDIVKNTIKNNKDCFDRIYQNIINSFLYLYGILNEKQIEERNNSNENQRKYKYAISRLMKKLNK